MPKYCLTGKNYLIKTRVCSGQLFRQKFQPPVVCCMWRLFRKCVESCCSSL